VRIKTGGFVSVANLSVMFDPNTSGDLSANKSLKPTWR